MNLPPFERIGVRLGLAVAGVLVLLALVTNVVTQLAFERAADAVHAASAAEFEANARTVLLDVTAREAQIVAASLERSAAAGRAAAAYLARRLDAPDADAAPLSLAVAPSGHLWDPDPTRRTTLHVPDFAAERPAALRDAAAGRALDDVFESLAPELGDGIGIYFLSPDGVTRYHPPIDFVPLVEPDFDATVQPVYLLGTPEANPTGATVWTPPYPDDVGNGLLVTAVSPVYAGGAFRGVLDVDVSLERLARRLAQVAPLPGSFAFLIDAEGRLVTASPGAAAGLGLDGELAFGTVLDAPLFDELQAHVLAGSSGLTSLATAAGPAVIAQSPVQGTGWSLAVGAPLSAVSAPAAEVAGQIAGQARRARQAVAIATLAAFLLALAVLVLATRRWVVHPIRALVAGSRRLGRGELGVTLPMGPAGEFRVLGEAFNRASQALADGREEILRHQRHLEEQVAERTRELSNLLALSGDLSTAPDAPTLLGSALLRLREVVPFERGAVWATEEAGLRRVAAAPRPAGSGTAPASLLRPHLDALTAGRPVAIPASDGAGALVGGAATVLLAPLVHRGRLSGVLAVADPVLREARATDLVAAVARQLGTALENARLLLDARERSALEERQHLARELHDSVSQALFGVVLGLQTARAEIEAPGRLRDAVEYAGELADAALKEMRALIFELRPEALEAEGLAGLLERQGDMLRARHELRVELAVEEPPLPLDAKAVLYRVAQEALHNVVKHAHASRVTVALAPTGDAVRLEVRDDGRGFVPGRQDAESYGLHSMRERMLLLGGTLEVHSEPGEGTRVVATLPASVAAPADGAAASS